MAAYEVMPVVEHSVDFREVEGGGDGVPLGVCADGEDGDVLGLAAKVEHDGVEFFGGEGALVGAMGVEEGEDGGFAFEL